MVAFSISFVHRCTFLKNIVYLTITVYITMKEEQINQIPLIISTLLSACLVNTTFESKTLKLNRQQRNYIKTL